MSEVDSTVSTIIGEADWSNLPHDLLSRIANGLGLIELLIFRCVCKDWRNASFKILSEYKSFTCYPWFLTYDGVDSECFLLSEYDTIYTTNVPELDDATCLASLEGWMLLFRYGSMFFFCPFSKAKIELPEFPFTDLSDHVAAFSSVPTSQDCMVAMIHRTSEIELELHLLCAGENKWTRHSYLCNEATFSTIKAAVYIDEEFHFLDGLTGLVTFDAAETKEWNHFIIVSDETVTDVLNYAVLKNSFGLTDMKRKLKLKGNVTVSTCGTLRRETGAKYDIIIENECIEAAAVSKRRPLKGVWIQPKYHMPSRQSW